MHPTPIFQTRSSLGCLTWEKRSRLAPSGNPIIQEWRLLLDFKMNIDRARSIQTALQICVQMLRSIVRLVLHVCSFLWVQCGWAAGRRRRRSRWASRPASISPHWICGASRHKDGKMTAREAQGGGVKWERMPKFADVFAEGGFGLLVFVVHGGARRWTLSVCVFVLQTTHSYVWESQFE